jgi:hypothetical protein
MSDEKKTKPEYEAPTVVRLSELAKGAGTCTAGSGDSTYCRSGGDALGDCTAGGVPQTYCTAGTTAPGACTAGATAITACSDGWGGATCTGGHGVT